MADLVYLVTFFKSFFSSLRHHSCFEWTNPYFENSAVANQLAIGLFTSRVSRAGRLTGQVSVERTSAPLQLAMAVMESFL